jgi:hypothetical protein
MLFPFSDCPLPKDFLSELYPALTPPTASGRKVAGELLRTKWRIIPSGSRWLSKYRNWNSRKIQSESRRSSDISRGLSEKGRLSARGGRGHSMWGRPFPNLNTEQKGVYFAVWKSDKLQDRDLDVRVSGIIPRVSILSYSYFCSLTFLLSGTFQSFGWYNDMQNYL